jgi:hypothetical protein
VRFLEFLHTIKGVMSYAVTPFFDYTTTIDK